MKILTNLSVPYVLRAPTDGKATPQVTHRCTASIGLVIFGSRDSASPQDLTKWADVAMYQAKSEGRNRISFAPQI
jgi:GGDEF domain-containing protein